MFLLGSLLRPGLDDLVPDLSKGLPVQPIIVLGFGLLLLLAGVPTLMLWNLGKLSGMIGFRVVLATSCGFLPVSFSSFETFVLLSISSVMLVGFKL